MGEMLQALGCGDLAGMGANRQGDDIWMAGESACPWPSIVHVFAGEHYAVPYAEAGIACDASHFLGVFIPHPYRRYQPWRHPYKPSVAVVLGSACFSCDRDAQLVSQGEGGGGAVLGYAFQQMS